MVLRCSWGTCNGDERYPERLQGAKLILFPKPKTQHDKCLRWIRACGRPHSQLDVNNINKHKAVCSRHFVGGQGPTADYPDPIPADGTPCKHVRSGPKKRRLMESQTANLGHDHTYYNCDENQCLPSSTEVVEMTNTFVASSTQTEDSDWAFSELQKLSTENEKLHAEVRQKDRTIHWLRTQLKQKEKKMKVLRKEAMSQQQFSLDTTVQKESKIKGLFKYYTGITYVRFLALLSFLIPDNFSLDFGKGRPELKKMSEANGLFFVLCRLRHDFGLKDLSCRFGLSVQAASVLFNTWICHMYLKLGQVSIWPHRDAIINQMPSSFKRDYPTTLVIIDGTEFKTQVPAALGLQSQMFSDYKSSTTLKALIGCDPSGSVVFVSELFTGSISDKAITAQSGFYELLKMLKDKGFVQDGDCVMADKGFTISEELKELGLSLNIPPFAPSGRQLPQCDVEATQKIARHRVHIERLIRKVKNYKILSNVIPTCLFQNINKIWTICCHMTLFQDTFVKDK